MIGIKGAGFLQKAQLSRTTVNMKLVFLFLVFLVAASADVIRGSGTGRETRLEKIGKYSKILNFFFKC